MEKNRTKSDTIINGKWGGDLTHENVGQILALADEAGGGEKWEEALAFISGYKTKEQIDSYMSELSALIDNF